MPSRSFTYRFEAIDAFSRVADRVTQSVEKMTLKADRLAAKAEKVGTAWKNAGGKLRSTGGDLSVLSVGIFAVGAAALKQAADFEQLGIAYDVLIGDTALAKETFQELTEYATKTPFKLKEVADAGKIMLAFKTPAEDVGDQLRMMGDLAAASGKPLTEFAMIFGKIKAKGKVTMEEVNQLAEKGVSVQSKLAEMTGKSGAEIAKMIAAGQVSAADIQVLLVEMTKEGSQFGGLAAKQAQSLGGIFSTLQGNMDIALAGIGEAISESIDLKGVLTKLSVWVERIAAGIKDFAKEHPGAMKMIIVFIGLVAVLGPLLLIVGQMAIAIGGLISLAGPIAAGFSAVAAAAGALAGFLGMSVGTLLIIPILIAAVIAAAVLLWKNWDTVTAAVGSGIDYVVSKLSFLTEGFDAIKGGFSKLGSLIGIGDEELAVSATSQTNVDINLSAPQGTVDSMQTKTTGAPTGQVGAAMTESL